MTLWRFAATENFGGVVGSVDLAVDLNRQVIAIDVASNQKKAAWNKAGDIIQLVDLEMLEGFFTRLEVSDSFSYLGFNPTLFKFQILSGNEYHLRFKPVPWLNDFSLTIWEYLGD